MYKALNINCQDRFEVCLRYMILALVLGIWDQNVVDYSGRHNCLKVGGQVSRLDISCGRAS